jgi:very-short-patch-repair endonuclease
MRAKPAPAEQKLWYCVRDRRLNGFKFRRQVPIKAYVADFYCAACRLIIEIDGVSHATRHDYDARRSEELTSLGYRIIRFSNPDVHEHLDAVLLAILRECESLSSSGTGPSPQPSPLNTRERE